MVGDYRCSRLKRPHRPVHWELQRECLHAPCTGLFLFLPFDEYYFEPLPLCCPPLYCVYTVGWLIVWQDWQAPWQSWLKALRSGKWDRYRANTCLLAVSQSPTGCVLHWCRINGSIKTQRFLFSFFPTGLPRLAWNLSPFAFYFPLLLVTNKRKGKLRH